jgi:hypothetical protein
VLRSYNLAGFAVHLIRGGDPSRPPGKGEAEPLSESTYPLPALPLRDYEEAMKNLDVIASMCATPLIWQDNQTLDPSCAIQVKNAEKIWTALQELPAIRDLWRRDDQAYYQQRRARLDPLKPIKWDSSYWMPTLPASVNKEKLKTSIRKIAGLISSIGKDTELPISRNAGWKSLTSELAPVITLFRIYNSPNHPWTIYFDGEKLYRDCRFELRKGAVVLFSKEFRK